MWLTTSFRAPVLPAGRAESTSLLYCLRTPLHLCAQEAVTAIHHRRTFRRSLVSLPAEQQFAEIARLDLHSNNEPIYPNPKSQNPKIQTANPNPQIFNIKSRNQNR
jgi:hypothetical protein